MYFMQIACAHTQFCRLLYHQQTGMSNALKIFCPVPFGCYIIMFLKFTAKISRAGKTTLICYYGNCFFSRRQQFCGMCQPVFYKVWYRRSTNAVFKDIKSSILTNRHGCSNIIKWNLFLEVCLYKLYHNIKFWLLAYFIVPGGWAAGVFAVLV